MRMKRYTTRLLGTLLAILLFATPLMGHAAEACEHDWNSITGVCKICAAECDHAFDAKSRCSICRYRCGHTAHDAASLVCDGCGASVAHDFTDGQCALCDATTVFEFKAVDDLYMAPASQQGTIEEIYYDTYAYGIERLAELEPGTLPIEGKRAYVYLPAGYDPANQYDIMYLLHGAGGSEGTWLGFNTDGDTGKFQHTAALLDNLFERGEAVPSIVVTPTFYTYVEEDSEYAAYNQEVDAILPITFQYELRDLIDVAETTYSTYAGGDTSPESLIASREHRAYSGLSMGARTSLNSIICGNMDIIGYVGSFSGSGVAYEEVEKALTETFKDYPILYWYNGEGTIDTAHDAHIALYEQIRENLPEIVTEGVNYIMVDKPGFGHNADNWYIDLYNVMQVFFKMD